MRLNTFLSTLVTAYGLTGAQSTTEPPGYLTGFSTVTASNLTFGSNYAVLNLDLFNALVGSINTTTEGAQFINSTATWINAVHAKCPRPLEIFTRLYFTNKYAPELGPKTPFAVVTAPFGNVTGADEITEVYPAFTVDDQDVVLQKTRYYAGAGNGLEEILSSQLIDTVILSGLRTSGVMLSTALRLFDLNYKVYIIGDNSIETPGDNAVAIDTAIKTGVIPKLPADVITLTQALDALQRSG